jgi:hypothetical protein
MFAQYVIWIAGTTFVFLPITPCAAQVLPVSDMEPPQTKSDGNEVLFFVASERNSLYCSVEQTIRFCLQHFRQW